MSFLAPLFLLGALAIAGPLIFHLVRRTTRERRVFSSLMFLLETPPRLTRRSRLEHLLLLLLRCAVVSLLAFGFARPFLKTESRSLPPPTETRRVVVLVDTSASMQRVGLWSEARARAETVLRPTSAADQVALMTFDRQVHPLVSFEQWTATPSGERVALALGKLADTSPGWSATHLGQALIRAAETLADTSGEPTARRSQIVLISDLPEGSHLEPLQGYEWPKGIELRVEPLQARQRGNAALHLVSDSDDLPSQASSGVRVRVSNTADSDHQQFKVGWAGPDGRRFGPAPLDVYVPPGQSRIVSVPVTAGVAGLDRILLEGDEVGFDNTVFVVPPEVVQVAVLYFGGDSEKDARQPLYFLQRAFRETRRQSVHVRVRSPDAPLPVTEAQDAGLFVVTDPVSEPLAGALRDRVVAGQTLLFVLDDAAAGPSLGRLLALERLDVAEAPPGKYALLADIDFRHPLFAPFADPRFSDFTKIHFWRHRRLDAVAIPGARVVAKFDDGDPALLDVTVGKGRVLVLTSGWHPDDSQLALSTKFVPLLYSVLEGSGAPATAPKAYEVGDVIPLPAAADGARPACVIQTPDGSELTLAAGQTDFSETARPGIYTLGAAQPPRRMAINLEAAESRTVPLAGDELERLGAPVSPAPPTAAQEAARQVRLESAELESRQQLWRWSLGAVIALLLLETGLAGRTARRPMVQGEAVS